MDFRLTPEQKAWVEEVRAFVRENVTPALLAELRQHNVDEIGPERKAFEQKLRARGWLALNWPKEYGGQERSTVEQFLFVEELHYAGVPLPGGAGPGMIGPTIIRFGTEENKRMWLPRIASGEIVLALGYSEPDSGTDLASLRTRAELVGDEWVINGKKIWNTFGHFATHQWLLARTDPDAPKHKGLSLFIVPMDAAGVSIRPIRHWGDHRTNEVFFDNVRIPRNYLIGEVNRGWLYVNTALDFERVVMGSSAHLRRLFDELVQHCRETVIDGERLIDRPEVRMRLAELDMDLEIARLFGLRAAAMIDAGKALSAEASMMKAYNTELYTKITDWGMQILDLHGQLSFRDPAAPLAGDLEVGYRLAPFHRFGGGTNEVQRNIIAQRGLGLPR